MQSGHGEVKRGGCVARGARLEVWLAAFPPALMTGFP